IPERPDSGEDKQYSSREDEEAVSRTPVNHAGDHGYIPPSALMLSCLVPSTAPFLVAVMVTCQVPPVSRFTWPSYMPSAFSDSCVRTFIAAMPICGIAGIKLRMLTCAPLMGAPSAPVSFTRYTLAPLRGVAGSVEKSMCAVVFAAGALIEAAAP